MTKLKVKTTTRLKAVTAAAVLTTGTTFLTLLVTLAQSGPVDARSHHGGMSSRHTAGTCGSGSTTCCCYTQHGGAFCAQEGACFNQGGTCAVTGC